MNLSLKAFTTTQACADVAVGSALQLVWRLSEQGRLRFMTGTGNMNAAKGRTAGNELQ
jgi:hypothetical protein